MGLIQRALRANKIPINKVGSERRSRNGKRKTKRAEINDSRPSPHGCQVPLCQQYQRSEGANVH